MWPLLALMDSPLLYFNLHVNKVIVIISLTISLGIEAPQLLGQVTGNLLHCPI